ncbi:MAG TPA: glycosyltransferase family 2 protein [Candidatus Sulfotelmatobacter sp.]|nr:glycosyltransferase family 2 protein [Candidatus Sulfotelmatobacter sp.]
MPESVDLTILMPCLNEAETLARCIEKAKTGLANAGVPGEILVADNGSTDGSQAIAEKLGVRVAPIRERGYGSAIIGGTRAARGKWIIMGDADDSYDFSEADRFVKKFNEGYDLVMGCRLPSGGGTILPGAMPWKNRWIGNPILTFIGRLFFKCPAHDFHSGLRGYTREAFEALDLQTTGMEFASEMVIKATLKKLKITEVPVTLSKDGRSRPPHLKPWRDGWRHLRFMLLFSPRWLFLIPGLALFVIGVCISVALCAGNIQAGAITLNVGTLAVSCMTAIVGFQLVAFAFFTKVFAIAEGLLPDDPKLTRVLKFFTLETGILAGTGVFLVGIILLARALWLWGKAHFGELPSMEDNLRRLIPAAALVVLGIQGIFSSFFMSALGLKTKGRKPPGVG